VKSNNTTEKKDPKVMNAKTNSIIITLICMKRYEI